jgi:predicted enzyme related to lactoylglutathione lyase
MMRSAALFIVLIGCVGCSPSTSDRSRETREALPPPVRGTTSTRGGSTSTVVVTLPSASTATPTGPVVSSSARTPTGLRADVASGCPTSLGPDPQALIEWDGAVANPDQSGLADTLVPDQPTAAMVCRYTAIRRDDPGSGGVLASEHRFAAGVAQQLARLANDAPYTPNSGHGGCAVALDAAPRFTAVVFSVFGHPDLDLWYQDGGDDSSHNNQCSPLTNGPRVVTDGLDPFFTLLDRVAPRAPVLGSGGSPSPESAAVYDRSVSQPGVQPAITMFKLAPVFPVSDLSASLAHYARLGFMTSEYTGESAAGGYGFARRDTVELHLGTDPHDRPSSPATAYLYVDDADALAAEWRDAGADVRSPEDTPWGQREGVMIDPDGNIIRFGSPL